MSEWREQKLDSIATLSKDTWKVGDEDAPYIGMEHIAEGTLRLSGIGDSNSVNSNKYRFNKGQFLFGKLRPYFRKVVRPKFDGVCSTDIWVIQPRNNIDADFAFYLFASQEFVDLAYSSASGTRMPRADWNFMKETEWFIPMEEKEQRAIAAVLSSLDDKIDLLHRQNKTLEQMAETLFRQWFIEPVRRGGEAKEDWKDGKLGDVIELIYGKGLKKEIRTGIGFPVVGSSGVVDYHSEFLVEAPGIVIGRKGTLGKTIYLWDNFFPIDTTYYVKSKVESAGLLYEYFLLKTLNFEEMNSDSAVPGLNRDIALSTEIKIAPFEKLVEFNKIVTELFNKMRLNSNQIRTLEKLRDTLLPKFMSGENRIEMN
ncbi:MAG: restriction endonuclease subunit S [Melioribacteraceae bacterium]|nr:restriction endonuclease subunit S [Melioribacteraceae bacterium]